MKSVFSVVCILMLAAVAAYAQTDGFTVLTTEAARRQAIQRAPLQVPPARLQAADGRQQDLHEFLAADGRVAIVNFMYTRCASVCLAMGNEFQQLQALIRERGLQSRVRLLSISFDPRDTPQWLDSYQSRMRADPDIWQSVLAVDDPTRQRLLEAFGIIVLPAPYGQYEHNAAFHVLTPQGRLSRIVDIEQAGLALHIALGLAREKAGS